MVNVGNKSLLPARDTRQRPFGALAAVGLKMFPRSFVTGFPMANPFRRVEFPIRGHRNAINPEVDPQTPRRRVYLGLRYGDRNMEIELPLAIDQFGGTELTLAQLPAHLRRHLQLAGDAPLRTDSQRCGVAVLPQDHSPGIVANRRMWLELMELVRFTHVCRTHLSNCVDYMLRGQVGFIPNQVIGGVMNVVLTTQILLKTQLRDDIAGAVELFHRGLQFFGRLSSNNQFGFYRKVNRHSPDSIKIMPQGQEIIACLRSQNP